MCEQSYFLRFCHLLPTLFLHFPLKYLVLQFPVLHFLVLHFPVLHFPTIVLFWSFLFRSCIFSPPVGVGPLHCYTEPPDVCLFVPDARCDFSKVTSSSHEIWHRCAGFFVANKKFTAKLRLILKFSADMQLQMALFTQ